MASGGWQQAFSGWLLDTAESRDEQLVRHEVDCILSADSDIENLQLGDMLDVPAVQAMADDFFRLTGIPMFLEDLKGKTLVGVGWQEICTKFHRLHPEARKNCIRGVLSAQSGSQRELKLKLHRCKNHLWEGVTPIMIGDRHIGNIVTGQLAFADEKIDYEFFRAQARQYGFDEAQYLAALGRVPRLQREHVDIAIAFFIKFAQLLSRLSYSSIKLERSSTQISRTNAELEATVTELEAFTYSVSHDLRAPLRHISGFSQILTEEFGANLPEEAQRHLRRIAQGTRHMGVLVDDLLNLARIGRRELTMQACGLRSLVDEVIEDLKPECQGREVEWKIGSLPFVECDPGLVNQVFQNLLSNALKFTRPRARSVIEIGQQEGQGPAVVYVRDNGVGFSMKYADKLFGVFQRLHRQEDFEGTGVGLASVQRIVHKHGGRIWTEAELDKGATFYFTLAPAKATEVKALAVVAGDRS